MLVSVEGGVNSYFNNIFIAAEAGWSQMEQRAWKSFRQRIYPNITEMMKNGVSVRVL